jgi:hypothetical protein
VSKALLISGMFMPKLGLVPVLGAAFDAALAGAAAGAGVATAGVAAAKAVASAAAAVAAAAVLWVLLVALEGAVSVARSHDPISWERATEKNRST